MKARCSGWSLSIVPSPSSVVMAPFAAADTGTEQERAGLPPISTVQAPHWASPQPNFGPFSSRSLRRTYKSGVSGATDDTRRVAPFTRNVNSAMISSGGFLCLGGERKRTPAGRRVPVHARDESALRDQPGFAYRPRGFLAAIELGPRALELLRDQALGVEAAPFLFHARAPP